MGWEVPDIVATVATTRDGIAAIQGNYPSKGTGEYGAWFKDSEGNLLGIGQPIP